MAWATISILLAGVGLAACGSSPPRPQATIASYLSAWNRQQWTTMAGEVDHPPAGFSAQHEAVVTDLGVRSATHIAGVVAQKGSSAAVPVTSRMTLATGMDLSLHSVVHLRLVKDHWLVEWSPATIDARLGAGDHFAIRATWATRASVLGAGGVSLTPLATTVTVGLAGLRIKDPATLQAALVAAGLDPTSVTRALAAAVAHPDLFEPIQTLSDPAYQAVKPAIYPLPGTQFETQSQQTPLTPDLGAQIVGTVGPVTAEQLHSLGAPYETGDQVGQGGIEGDYERRLVGTPASAILIVGPRGARVATVASSAAVSGAAVQTSIDPKFQAAAEGALVGVTQPAAIVVIRASTGQVLASASLPTTGFDLALGATVPPGSTFKVITSTALLQSGVTVSTPASCPPTIDVAGRSFHNDEGESVPSLSFAQAFAQSCNTAFIGLSTHLSDTALPAAAKLFGIGVTPQMGLPAYGGRVPASADAVGLAATSIGQGQVTVSPLVMATVAAAVDSGSLHEPRLVVGAPDDSLSPTALDPAVIAALHTLMAGVVSAGTAAGAGLPAGTYGKTGTAEYGGGANPPTHAWFIGFRGDVAFAVLVYGGGTGATVAAPLAAKMLATLGPGP